MIASCVAHRTRRDGPLDAVPYTSLDSVPVDTPDTLATVFKPTPEADSSARCALASAASTYGGSIAARRDRS